MFSKVSVDKLNEGSNLKLISIEDMHQNGKSKTYATCLMKGTRSHFKQSIDEIYNSSLIKEFSKREAAYIGLLYGLETKTNAILLGIPSNQNNINNCSYFLESIFIAFLIISNMIRTTIDYNNFIIDSAIILYPLTLIISDVITEIYGFKVLRRLLIKAFIINFIIVILSKVVISFPFTIQNDLFHLYKKTFDISIITTSISFIAYFIGDSINSLILSRLKILTAGKYFWLRAIGSTIVGEFVDKILFYSLSTLSIGSFRTMLRLGEDFYFAQIFYEIIFLPVTYYICYYIKKKENIDHYDCELFNVSLNRRDQGEIQ
jgi:uncharacterized integral membrane protein (TIGR00697 family)